jgi:hypothetical protein
MVQLRTQFIASAMQLRALRREQALVCVFVDGVRISAVG